MRSSLLFDFQVWVSWFRSSLLFDDFEVFILWDLGLVQVFTPFLLFLAWFRFRSSLLFLWVSLGLVEVFTSLFFFWLG